MVDIQQVNVEAEDEEGLREEAADVLDAILKVHVYTRHLLDEAGNEGHERQAQDDNEGQVDASYCQGAG